jgi:hypothetical protein
MREFPIRGSQQVQSWWRGGKSLLVASALSGLLIAFPADARRTVIDSNEWGVSLEVTGDAEDGESTVLPFGVDYGAGLQTDVTIGMEPCCITSVGEPPEVPVSVNFTASPGDSIFATLLWPEPFINGQGTAVRLSNEEATSEPLDPVDEASIFEFGIAHSLTSVPGFPTEETGSVGFYTPFSGGVTIQFSDLSSSGTAGDFELLLLCSGLCTNIGFSLAGLDFSLDAFDPLSAPSQLVSYELGDGSSSFRFAFRNAAAVPEPDSWAMMLLGFGAVGFAFRRRRASIHVGLRQEPATDDPGMYQRTNPAN